MRFLKIAAKIRVSLSNNPTNRSISKLALKTGFFLLDGVGNRKHFPTPSNTVQHTFQHLFLIISLLINTLTLCWICWKIKWPFFENLLETKFFFALPPKFWTKKRVAGKKGSKREVDLIIIFGFFVWGGRGFVKKGFLIHLPDHGVVNLLMQIYVLHINKHRAGIVIANPVA